MQADIDNKLDSIAKNVRYYRKQAKISQEKLAEMVDCSREFINRIENRKEDLSLKLLIKISLVLKIETECLFQN